MSRLFLIAASGREAREHLEISLSDGVELSHLASLEGLSEELANRSENGRVYVWGATPGTANVGTWERLDPGDVGLVYSQGAFPFCARVFAKARSAPVADSIWGTGSNGTWELMYFLESPRPINAPLDEVRTAFGYSPNWIPQGFSFLGEEAEVRLEEKYGGFDGFLNAVSTIQGTGQIVAEPPEIARAVEAIDRVAEPAKRKGQGRQASPELRRAIELHAMELATAHYESLGWDVTDVSARQSYDLLCSMSGMGDRRIEVKGTTSVGAEVLLTRNEVANARAEYPNVALVVVGEISVDKSTKTPKCHGGKINVIDPWSIDEGTLAPLAFSYALPEPE